MLEDVRKTDLKLARTMVTTAHALAMTAERAERSDDYAAWRANINVAFGRVLAAAALLAHSYDCEPERTEIHLTAIRIAIQSGFFRRTDELIRSARESDTMPDEFIDEMEQLESELSRARSGSLADALAGADAQHATA